MKSPKVSIIVAVYNAEKYINKCLNSILAQTMTDWECLLIDDGSPDSSGNICDKYAEHDSRFTVIHKKNGGVSSARQCGLNNAKGHFIVHVDPDDWIEKKMLEDMYSFAVQNSADILISDFIWNYSKNEKYDSQKPSALDTETVLCNLFQFLHGSCCNKFVRRDMIEKYNVFFPQEINIYEDLFFIVSLLKEQIKVEYIPKAYYHYVIGENSNGLSQTIRQSYSEDKKILQVFSSLTKGHRAFIWAKAMFAYKMVDRDYHRSDVSLLLFMKRNIKYLPLIWIKYGSIIGKIKLTLACFGFRNILKKIK